VSPILRNGGSRLWLLPFGISLGVAACSPQATPTAPTVHQESPFRLTASIQEIMDAQIDPAADVLWGSVATISNEAGVEERQPRTDEEWKAVRRSALTLIEATNLLTMEGRRVAPANAPSSSPDELSPVEIQQRLDASRASFAQFAHALQEAGLKALNAIDAKDPQALMDAGGTIDEACEACHVTFWYPNQKLPRS
jgi:hypothetical protein